VSGSQALLFDTRAEARAEMIRLRECGAVYGFALPLVAACDDPPTNRGCLSWNSAEGWGHPPLEGQYLVAIDAGVLQLNK